MMDIYIECKLFFADRLVTEVAEFKGFVSIFSFQGQFIFKGMKLLGVITIAKLN